MIRGPKYNNNENRNRNNKYDSIFLKNLPSIHIFQLRSRQADEYRSLEEDYRQRHQRLHEAHEQEIQNCIRRYFAKNNQEQPEDLSLHRGVPTLTPLPSAPDSAQSSQFGSPPLLGGHLGGQHTPSSSQQLPIVTLAASNLLMPPPASLGGLSSHSSNEDCSGCSYAVKHKLQEHLMQKHRRECTTCALKMGNITGGKYKYSILIFIHISNQLIT